MRTAAALILSLIAIAPLSEVDAALSLSVMPPIMELSVPPGGNKVVPVTVKNVGDMEVVVTPAVMDLKLDLHGAALPVARGDGAPSCADWIDMDLGEFGLGPGESLERDVTLQVPRGVGGGAYCVLVFEARPVSRKGAGSGLNLATRTGTIVMESISRRALRAGEIADVRTSRPSEDEVRITALFENKGEIHVQIRPSCVVKNMDGRVIDRIEMNAGTGTVLPQGLREVTGTWANKRKMLPGSYVVEVSADYRGGKRATGSTELTLE